MQAEGIGKEVAGDVGEVRSAGRVVLSFGVAVVRGGGPGGGHVRRGDWRASEGTSVHFSINYYYCGCIID